jgi:hypothetical protein
MKKGAPEKTRQAMTDDEIEELVRELIEVNLDEETRKAALEWLEKRTVTYQALSGLGLVDKAD